MTVAMSRRGRPRRPRRARRYRPAPTRGPAGRGPPRRGRGPRASAGSRRPGSRRPVRPGPSVSSPANPPVPRSWTVRGRRTALVRTPRVGQRQQASTAGRAGRPRSRSAAGPPRWRPARHPGRAGHDGHRPAAADERLAERHDRRRLLGDQGGDRLGGAEVAPGGEADHAVRLRRAGPQDVEVGQLPPEHLGAGRLERAGRAVRPGQARGRVWPCSTSSATTGDADGAGAARDEDVHEYLLDDGTDVPSP